MGNPFVHFELASDDVVGARKFYTKVFDWKIGPSDPTMGDYALIDFGSKTSGGGLTRKMTPGQPTAWLSYVEVDSVKKTMAKAMKAGGTSIIAFQDIGPMGAIGIFLDPQGAGIGIWERGKPAKKASVKKAAKLAATPTKKSTKSTKSATTNNDSDATSRRRAGR
jgi:predicted enzyme related to lactoylglutathione lyase